MTAEKLVRNLWIITAALVGLHILNLITGAPSWQLERLFDLDGESNLPTWFSSVLWLLASVMAYQCSELSAKGSVKRSWFLVAAGLLFLSIDEVAMIHEKFDQTVATSPLFGHFLGRFHDTRWPVFAFPFVLLFFVWLAANLGRSLAGSTQSIKFFTVGFLLFVGAMGLELITNLPFEQMNLYWAPELETVAEELMEMSASLVLITGLLAHRRFLEARIEETAGAS